MTNSSRTTATDFATPTTDRAPALPSHLQQPYGSFDAGHAAAAAPGLPEVSPVPVQIRDPGLNYSDFHPQAQHVAPDQLTAYVLDSQASTGWAWPPPIHLPNYPNFSGPYEPQGELVHELHNHNISANDFSIPLSVATADAAVVSPSLQQPRGSNPTLSSAQNPLLPPPRPAPQKPAVHSGMKRKAEPEPGLTVSQNTTISLDQPPKRQSKSRQSSVTSNNSPVISAASTSRRPSIAQAAAASGQIETASQAAGQNSNSAERRKEQSKGTGPQGRVTDVSKSRRILESSYRYSILPSRKVFPIQIGSKLFRLSGASLSSDAPSYFSHFFGEQLVRNGDRASDVRTLYIDRDPDTFRDVVLHLQGYHITPKDSEHFVKLFADAQFYSLPRLTKQLFSTDIFIEIGGRPFQIPRDLFSAPGDSPNYFSLGFAQYFSTPSEVFPGLDRSTLLRPPSISPPSVPNRSGETFGELIQLLQGYSVDIRDDAHRTRLLRDARYFHLKGLEQRLIPCEISYNLKRQQSEILVRLEDIRQSGVSFHPDRTTNDLESGTSTSTQAIGISPGQPSASKGASPMSSSASSSGGGVVKEGYVSYARPYTDDNVTSSILILEISTAESTTLHLPSLGPEVSFSNSIELNVRATFHNASLARMSSLFSVIASKMGLPATQPLGVMHLHSGSGIAAQPVSPATSGVSDHRVRVRLDTSCALSVNGELAEIAMDKKSGRIGFRAVSGSQGQNQWLWGGSSQELTEQLESRLDEEELRIEWTVKRAQWRIRVEPVQSEGEFRKMQVVLCAVKMEAFSVERNRNAQRKFLCSG